jgi:hypothetical protein
VVADKRVCRRCGGDVCFAFGESMREVRAEIDELVVVVVAAEVGLGGVRKTQRLDEKDLQSSGRRLPGPIQRC